MKLKLFLNKDKHSLSQASKDKKSVVGGIKKFFGAGSPSTPKPEQVSPPSESLRSIQRLVCVPSCVPLDPPSRPARDAQRRRAIYVTRVPSAEVVITAESAPVVASEATPTIAHTAPTPSPSALDSPALQPSSPAPLVSATPEDQPHEVAASNVEPPVSHDVETPKLAEYLLLPPCTKCLCAMQIAPRPTAPTEDLSAAHARISQLEATIVRLEQEACSRRASQQRNTFASLASGFVSPTSQEGSNAYDLKLELLREKKKSATYAARIRQLEAALYGEKPTSTSESATSSVGASASWIVEDLESAEHIKNPHDTGAPYTAETPIPPLEEDKTGMAIAFRPINRRDSAGGVSAGAIAKALDMPDAAVPPTARSVSSIAQGVNPYAHRLLVPFELSSLYQFRLHLKRRAEAARVPKTYSVDIFNSASPSPSWSHQCESWVDWRAPQQVLDGSARRRRELFMKTMQRRPSESFPSPYTTQPVCFEPVVFDDTVYRHNPGNTALLHSGQPASATASDEGDPGEQNADEGVNTSYELPPSQWLGGQGGLGGGTGSKMRRPTSGQWFGRH
ncbi:hypothetical protein FRB90_001012 [Tulasnella sp. 427]|nr:hypothetical protein FRB90_001012 [Tulasnella sp. 427]